MACFRTATSTNVWRDRMTIVPCHNLHLAIWMGPGHCATHLWYCRFHNGGCVRCARAMSSTMLLMPSTPGNLDGAWPLHTSSLELQFPHWWPVCCASAMSSPLFSCPPLLAIWRAWSLRNRTSELQPMKEHLVVIACILLPVKKPSSQINEVLCHRCAC